MERQVTDWEKNLQNTQLVQDLHGNVQKALKNQQRENKHPKWRTGKRPGQTAHQGRHTGGKEAQDTPSGKHNGTSKTPPHRCQDGARVGTDDTDATGPRGLSSATAGMRPSAATLGAGVVLPHKPKQTLNMQPSDYTPAFIQDLKAHVHTKTCTQVFIYSSFIHNCQNPEATKVSFRR